MFFEQCAPQSPACSDPPYPPGLCNVVPPCLRSRIDSFQGTSLVDVVRGSDAQVGGAKGGPGGAQWVGG